mmetsp:Transcript_72397/g.182667  ORF Transcript_72397/g.182667 Transcript_72397/m.182667 type:complete len:230 (+) Transcript_72397:789-1478(+)
METHEAPAKLVNVGDAGVAEIQVHLLQRLRQARAEHRRRLVGEGVGVAECHVQPVEARRRQHLPIVRHRLPRLQRVPPHRGGETPAEGVVELLVEVVLGRRERVDVGRADDAVQDACSIGVATRLRILEPHVQHLVGHVEREPALPIHLVLHPQSLVPQHVSGREAVRETDCAVTVHRHVHVVPEGPRPSSREAQRQPDLVATPHSRVANCLGVDDGDGALCVEHRLVE